MARFDLIDMDYDPDEYVVQRDDGTCYKRFKDYSEARHYYNYLQQLDDQKRTVAQNDEIIANQKRLLEMHSYNTRIPSRPQVIRQVLDPEYQEWLQFKKETDPAFIALKAAEDRKKQAREREAFERKQKEDKRYLETHLADVSYYEQRLEKFHAVYSQIHSLYETACKISFVGTAKVDYETEDGYHHIVFNGGNIWKFRDYEGKLSKSYATLDTYLKYNPSYKELCKELRKVSREGLRTIFDKKRNQLSSLDNNYSCFYNYFLTYTHDIIKEFDDLSSPYYCNNLTFKPYGFFAKLRVKRVVNEYLSKNKSNYVSIKSIYQKLLSLLGPCGISG